MKSQLWIIRSWKKSTSLQLIGGSLKIQVQNLFLNLARSKLSQNLNSHLLLCSSRNLCIKINCSQQTSKSLLKLSLINILKYFALASCKLQKWLRLRKLEISNLVTPALKLWREEDKALNHWKSCLKTLEICLLKQNSSLTKVAQRST